MNGRISVESKEGQGSTFTVCIPFKVVPDYSSSIIHKPMTKEQQLVPQWTTNDSTTVGSSSTPPTAVVAATTKFNLPANDHVVLVVDDNAMNRKLIGRMLTQFGVEYRQVCNGQEAVDVIRASRNATGDSQAPFYRLILMDLSMPVLDGIQATSLLREDGFTLPIVALTANTIETHRQQALDAGATEFIAKPILREDLRAKCQEYLVDAYDTQSYDGIV